MDDQEQPYLPFMKLSSSESAFIENRSSDHELVFYGEVIRKNHRIIQDFLGKID